MYLLPPILMFILHHLFQYVNPFLAGVNGTLVIWCLIVYLGFVVLDIVLQICHSPLIFLISNDLIHFLSLFSLLYGMDAFSRQTDEFLRRFLCSTHFCYNSIFWQADYEVSVVADVWEIYFCWKVYFLPGLRPSLLVLLVMILVEANSRSGPLSSDPFFARIGDDVYMALDWWLDSVSDGDAFKVT